MPLHWNCVDQGSYLSWNLPQCQDDEDYYCSPELPSLYQEIPKASNSITFNNVTFAASHYLYGRIIIYPSSFFIDMRRDIQIFQHTYLHVSV